ncbi:hypothetical protein JTB14_003244 [Gonioctena quinquepunctata]|nr:hypothetical protein JTB14_003244 [Gonioctena quinquepunctata]
MQIVTNAFVGQDSLNQHSELKFSLRGFKPPSAVCYLGSVTIEPSSFFAYSSGNVEHEKNTVETSASYSMAKSSTYEAVSTGMSSVCDEEENFVYKQASDGLKFGKRHIQVLLLASLFFLSVCVRDCMGICIVAITDPTASINKDIPTYDWKNKNVIIASFFWGFMMPQLVAGWLTNTYGPKWFLVGSMILCSILGLLIPLSALTIGDGGVIACRALQGFAQAFIPPAASVVIGKWIPSSERSRLSAFIFSGISAGSAASMFFSGYLAASWYGWPMVFYIYNGFGLIWSILFCYYGRDCPGDHPTISREEKLLIENSLGKNTHKLERRESSVPPTPRTRNFDGVGAQSEKGNIPEEAKEDKKTPSNTARNRNPPKTTAAPTEKDRLKSLRSGSSSSTRS